MTGFIDPNTGRVSFSYRPNPNKSTEQLIEDRAQELADERARQEKSIDQNLSSGKIFQTFNRTNDIQENIVENVTAALWSDNQTVLSSMFSGSSQTAIQKKYYYSVYQEESSLSTAEKQFDIAYGNRLGSGSEDGADTNSTYNETAAMYKTFRRLLLDPGETNFTFKNNVTSDHVYIITLDRARFKDRVDPGNWQLTLGSLDGGSYANNVHTGSNVTYNGGPHIQLIDDSGDSDNSVVSLTDSGRVYNIVSGSIENGVNVSNTQGFGLFYPDHGVMVLNADMLDASASFNTVTGSNIAGDNAFKLFTSISGSAAADSANYGFEGRSSEDVTTTYYYVRMRNADFNFSTNPSFTTGSLGEFRFESFIGNPKVYVTTVGLYNNRNELIAVAKTSQPIPKTFDSEVLIKVKLDF